MKHVFVVMWNYSEAGYNQCSGIQDIFSNEPSAQALADRLNLEEEPEDEANMYTVERFEVKD